MGLRFDPVGQGRFKEVVRTIIEQESQPIRSLEARKQIEETKLKLFQEFKAKFSGFKSSVDAISSFKKLRELKVDLGNGKELMEVSLDKEKAVPGTYQIEIEGLAHKSSVISNHFEDPNEPEIGIGFIVGKRENGEDFEIFIDDHQSSLSGIAAMINDVQDSPIRASVVKDVYHPDKPWRLILSSKKEGDNNSVVFPEFYFLGGEHDFWVDDSHDSQNAYLRIDNFEIEGESNDIPDFLQGINIRLKEARPDQPFTMRITEDFEKISGKVKEVVNNINGVLEFINKQNAVDEKTDTRTMFTGDTGLQSVEYRLRNLTHEAFPGSWDDGEPKLVFLSDLGIEIARNGQLTFNESKFQQKMEKNFDEVAEAVSGEFGFARQLGNVISGFMQPGSGMLQLREKTINQRIQKIDDDIDFKQRNIERRQQALVEKFSRLQGALANMQQQQAYIGATLGGQGGNIVSQLLGG